MSTTPCYNFNAGPTVLPQSVLTQLQDELGHRLKDGKTQPSILEISHRAPAFTAVLEETKALFEELLSIPKNYQLLLMQGGASHQFAIVPLNLLDKVADYAITGYWSEKAKAEAEVIGEVCSVFSSRKDNYRQTPAADEMKPGPDSSYLHITSNNTIYGTQYRQYPETGDIPLVADMSSDFLSRPLDVSRFGLIYACAQKNLAPAGVTAVIIREDLLQRDYRRLPKILRYKTHAEKDSVYNTPPVFQIFATCLVLRWLKKEGGLAVIERRNREKAALLYQTLDASSIYRAHADAGSRSVMNVTFTLTEAELTKIFLEQAAAEGLIGLKGHRAVGGLRASIYNACPLEHVQVLADFMREFERCH